MADDEKVSQKTEFTTPTDDDLLYAVDVGTPNLSKKITWANVKATLKTYFDTLFAQISTVSSGWNSSSATWSYSSADAPTFIASVNADMTTTIYPGQRLSLTQTTEKFFIVTAVGAYSGGNTLITMYGGTDYTLAAAAITGPKWSNVKVPSRFPMSPTKWTVAVTDTTIRSQAATGGTWYNLGSVSIVVPIGLWRGGYDVVLQPALASAGQLEIVSTLSTANNSESDSTMSRFVGGNSILTIITPVSLKDKIISVASKTTYYLNTKSDQPNHTIYNRNDKSALVISFTCAYL